MLRVMSDAYRSSAFKCPVCSEAPLREFQDRLVCDECGGMLIHADDMTASLHELDASTDKLEVAPVERSSAICPRCSQPLQSCTMQFGALSLGGMFLRCERDGIWFPRDAMTSIFARVSRRRTFRGSGMSSAGGGVSGSAGSFIANMPSAHSGMSGAMASIANAFGGGGSASAGLAISNWGVKRPRVVTLYVSAHKDRRLGCPACKETALSYQGDRWACSTCAGSFVETAALAGMITEMSHAPWEAPAIAGAPGERCCPICNTKMVVEVLEAVTVDRCTAHGVWFDDTELQSALQHASGEPPGLGGWLKRLFHRHGKAHE